MDALSLLILVAAGLGGGFVAGLVGVGGGVVFAPVLFFFFQSIGVPPEVIAPTTVGTSLLCTLTASSMSAWQHHREGLVGWRVAIQVGLLSAVALYLVVTFVTTQSWYDRFAFQLVFGTLLLVVAVQMVMKKRETPSPDEETNTTSKQPSVLALGSIGTLAGAIAGLAGVGGGIVMVPAYRQILRMPMSTSVGTSSGAIVLISALGVVGYLVAGWSPNQGIATLGYVDVAHGLLLALPAIPGARSGAKLAQRLPMRFLQTLFAGIAGLVALRMLATAVSGL